MSNLLSSLFKQMKSRIVDFPIPSLLTTEKPLTAQSRGSCSRLGTSLDASAVSQPKLPDKLLALFLGVTPAALLPHCGDRCPGPSRVRPLPGNGSRRFPTAFAGDPLSYDNSKPRPRSVITHLPPSTNQRRASRAAWQRAASGGHRAPWRRKACCRPEKRMAAEGGLRWPKHRASAGELA